MYMVGITHVVLSPLPLTSLPLRCVATPPTRGATESQARQIVCLATCRPFTCGNYIRLEFV